MMKVLKMPKVLTIGKGETAFRIRHNIVVTVVVSMAPAARLYVHVKRVFSEPEIELGMTALSFHVSLNRKMSSARSVNGAVAGSSDKSAAGGGGGGGGVGLQPPLTRADAKDQEQAKHLKGGDLRLAAEHPQEHCQGDRGQDLKDAGESE